MSKILRNLYNLSEPDEKLWTNSNNIVTLAAELNSLRLQLNIMLSPEQKKIYEQMENVRQQLYENSNQEAFVSGIRTGITLFTEIFGISTNN